MLTCSAPPRSSQLRRDEGVPTLTWVHRRGQAAGPGPMLRDPAARWHSCSSSSSWRRFGAAIVVKVSDVSISMPQRFTFSKHTNTGRNRLCLPMTVAYAAARGRRAKQQRRPGLLAAGIKSAPRMAQSTVITQARPPPGSGRRSRSPPSTASQPPANDNAHTTCE